MDDDYNTKALADIARTLADLMTRSEQRIERTNNMIASMAEHEQWIEEMYLRHIDMLEDKLFACVDEKKRIMTLLSETRKEYHRLLDKYEFLAQSRGQAGTTVTVA